MLRLIEHARFVNAKPPVANAFAGTVYPAGVNLANYEDITFVVQKGVGTTGTTTITVVAGDAACPINESAVPFSYRRIPSNNITPGAVTAATSAGFTTTAGSSDSYIVEINAKALAASGYKYVSLKMVESVASAVVGSVLAIATGPRFADSTTDIVS